MVKFSLFLSCLVGISLIVFVNSSAITKVLEKQLNLGGVIGLNLTIPSIALAISIEGLIGAQAATEIQSRPVDYNKVADCTTNDVDNRNGVTNPNAKWYFDSNSNTYYAAIALDPGLTMEEKNVVYAGIKLIQDKTCMRYYVYDESYLRSINADYIYVQRTSSGCYSDSIGRARKGKQVVNLQPTDSQGRTCMIAGIAAHELLHATGFHHAQNTPGRDDYVTIQFGNIISGREHNFYECTTCSAFGAPYDFDSLMHYGAYDFTKNGQKTIVTKNGASIGQRRDVSQWDAFKVNKLNGCPT